MSDKIETVVTKYERGTISRRQLLAALAALTAAGSTTSVSGEEQENEKAPAFRARSLNHVTLSVSSVERSKQFYQSILGIEEISRQKNGINLGVGESFIGLYRIQEPPRVNHFCLGLDEFDVQQAADRLKEYGIKPYVRQDKPEVYFRDPDGISVQLENKHYRG